jgi:small subunit ribosomal protein S16
VLRFLDKAGIAKREARNNPQKALPGEAPGAREGRRSRHHVLPPLPPPPPLVRALQE